MTLNTTLEHILVDKPPVHASQVVSFNKRVLVEGCQGRNRVYVSKQLLEHVVDAKYINACRSVAVQNCEHLLLLLFREILSSLKFYMVCIWQQNWEAVFRVLYDEVEYLLRLELTGSLLHEELD